MAQQHSESDVGSFVSFALATKSSVILQRHCKDDPLRGKPVKIDFEKRPELSKGQVETLEGLLKRYEPLREALHIDEKHADDRRGFDIETCEPRVEFKPGVKYDLISINERQARIAKRVASLAEKAHASHRAGDHAAAKSSFSELERYLEGERDNLVGDFGRIDRISNVVGLHGVGQNGNPAADGDCGGLVIFVIIEIFVGFAPDNQPAILPVRQ